MLSILTNLSIFKLYFLVTTGLICPTKLAIEMLLLFEVYCVEKAINIVPGLESRCFIIGTELGFQNRFLPKILSTVFSLRSQPKVFYFCWNMRLRVTNFRPCDGILMDLKFQMLLLVLTCFVIQTRPLSSSFSVPNVN